jgi:hypothetical protein
MTNVVCQAEPSVEAAFHSGMTFSQEQPLIVLSCSGTFGYLGEPHMTMLCIFGHMKYVYVTIALRNVPDGLKFHDEVIVHGLDKPECMQVAPILHHDSSFTADPLSSLLPTMTIRTTGLPRQWASHHPTWKFFADVLTFFQSAVGSSSDKSLELPGRLLALCIDIDWESGTFLLEDSAKNVMRVWFFDQFEHVWSEEEWKSCVIERHHPVPRVGEVFAFWRLALCPVWPDLSRIYYFRARWNPIYAIIQDVTDEHGSLRLNVARNDVDQQALDRRIWWNRIEERRQDYDQVTCQHCGASRFVLEKTGECCKHGTELLDETQRTFPAEMNHFLSEWRQVLMSHSREVNQLCCLASLGVKQLQDAESGDAHAHFRCTPGVRELYKDQFCSIHGRTFHFRSGPSLEADNRGHPLLGRASAYLFAPASSTFDFSSVTDHGGIKIDKERYPREVQDCTNRENG